MPGACDGLIVLETGDGCVASALTGMFLADNGARVIKIEPTHGDTLRTASPSGWLVWNRGKESLVLDLETSDGEAQLRALARSADVLIDGMPAGYLQEHGLGPEKMQADNLALVFCRVRAFGESGPYAAIPPRDALVLAKAGIFCRGIFGFREGPIFTGGVLASYGAAHMALSGVLAALIARAQTGQGQVVSASLFQGMNPIDYFMTYHYQLTAKEQGASNENAATADRSKSMEAAWVKGMAASRYVLTAATSDGRWIAFNPQLVHQTRALMEVLGLEAMYEDERFKNMPSFASPEIADEWDHIVWARMKEMDSAEVIARGRENPDLPFEPVLRFDEVLDHPQLRHCGDVVTIEDEVFGPIEQPGPLCHLSRTPASLARTAPRLNQHSPLPQSAVLAEGNGTTSLDHPLHGITIVEFGYFYAMPFGVTMAGALGARVIKVENLEGDPQRWAHGKPEWGGAKTMEGKESICLDLRSEEGKQIVAKLLAKADIVVQGFRPGVADRLGIGFDDVKAIRPDIVYVHATGYGADGPMAHRPMYASAAGAVSGGVYRQAEHWLDPELSCALTGFESQALVGERLRGLSEGDSNAALSVLSAALLGLWHRARTGEGQFISTSMIASNVLAHADGVVRYRGKSAVPAADADQFGTDALNRLYPAKTGWVFLSVATQHEWEVAMTTAGLPDLVEDPRFDSPTARAKHDDVLTDLLGQVFATREASEWERVMLPAGVGCVVASENSQAAITSTDPNLREMGLVVPVNHSRFGSLVRYAAPTSFSRTPPRIAAGCLIAQHTKALLEEVGCSQVQIEELAARRIVRLEGSENDFGKTH